MPKIYEFKLNKDYYESFFDKRKEIGYWNPWINLNTTQYIPSKSSSFHEIIVPTKDILRIYFFLDLYASNNMHALFCGPTGTGKTACVLDKLRLSFYSES